MKEERTHEEESGGEEGVEEDDEGECPSDVEHSCYQCKNDAGSRNVRFMFFECQRLG